MVQPRQQPEFARFQHVTCEDNSTDTDLIPDFFLAGPNRTGSTWLHRQLTRHPELHFATPKEIYYFSSLGQSHHPLHESNDLDWYLNHFRITDAVKDQRQTQCRTDFDCDFKPQRQGEASASYAVGVDAARAADILTLNPNLKLVIVARHPVERAWSHIKFDARLQGLDTKKMTEDQFGDVLHRNRYILRCGMYSQMQAFWSQRLPEGHLFMTPFDRISSEPVAMLQEVARFLEVDDDERYFAVAHQEGRNETAAVDIPRSIEAELYDHYRNEIELISAHHGLNWKSKPTA